MTKKTLLASFLVCGISSTAHAGGYYAGNKGARAAGRAGAFTAKADDISAVLYNPAGIAKVGTTLLQVGNRFSFHNSTYTRAPTLDWGQGMDPPPLVEFDPVSNQTPAQLLDPMIGVITNFGKLENWGFGLVIMAPPGIARLTFPVEGGQRYMMVSRDAKMLNYSLSAAWKHKDVFGLGLSLQWIHTPVLKYQVVIDGNPFTAQQVNPVSSGLDLLATVQGADIFTPNAVLGAWYRPIQAIELGLSGQVVPSSIKTKSTLSLEPISSDVGTVQLSRNGQPANDVTLTLPLPMSARFGIRYRHLRDNKERFDIELNATYEAWSFAKQFHMSGEGLVANAPEVAAEPIPVNEIILEKRWRHVFGVALGSDIVAIPERLVVRAGVRYESPTARRAYTNVDFATGHMIGSGLGLSVLVKGFEIALAYEAWGQVPVRVTEEEGRVYQQVPASNCQDPQGCNPNIPGPSPVVNAGRYAASSHAASLELLYRF